MDIESLNYCFRPGKLIAVLSDYDDSDGRHTLLTSLVKHSPLDHTFAFVTSNSLKDELEGLIRLGQERNVHTSFSSGAIGRLLSANEGESVLCIIESWNLRTDFPLKDVDAIRAKKNVALVLITRKYRGFPSDTFDEADTYFLRCDPQEIPQQLRSPALNEHLKNWRQTPPHIWIISQRATPEQSIADHKI